jgi:hypothetical protein
MKYLAAAALCLAAPAALASDDKSPRICPTQANVAAVDLGHYFGVYMVTRPQGAALAPGTWQACPPPRPGAQLAWETCNFSLCNLPEGAWQVRFSDQPASAYLSFSVDSKGVLTAPDSDFLQQVGHFGIDATGFHKPVRFDLRGYSQGWNVELWPEPEFRGSETNGRGGTFRDYVVLSLYPHTPYRLRFGEHVAATIVVNKFGAPESVSSGGALRDQAGILQLRAVKLRVTPPAGGWQLEGTTMLGVQDMVLPANSSFRLHGAAGEAAELTLDAACKPSVTGHGFTATLAPGAKPAITCQK